MPPIGHSPVAHAHMIGIGGRIAPPPLPHHRTYGSVYGGSISYGIDPRSMKEVQARPDRRSTRLGPQLGCGSRATGRGESRPLSWPPPHPFPAAPVPQNACGRFSTVARRRCVPASVFSAVLSLTYCLHHSLVSSRALGFSPRPGRFAQTSFTSSGER